MLDTLVICQQQDVVAFAFTSRRLNGFIIPPNLFLLLQLFLFLRIGTILTEYSNNIRGYGHGCSLQSEAALNLDNVIQWPRYTLQYLKLFIGSYLLCTKCANKVLEAYFSCHQWD